MGDSIDKEIIFPFSVCTNVLEKELQEKRLLNLELRISKRGIGGDLERKELISFNPINFSEDQSYWKNLAERVLENMGNVSKFNSMLVKNEEELFEHINIVHNLLSSHYHWAKNNNLRGTFPKKCCNVSAYNIFFSLFDIGYSNATRVTQFNFKHAYNLLPFILENSGKKGFICLDPTSDQIKVNGYSYPKNNITILPEIEKKDTLKQDNYSGQHISSFANLATLNKDVLGSYTNFDFYLSQVFKNVVKVNIVK
jgi:hypothetical protein